MSSDTEAERNRRHAAAMKALKAEHDAEVSTKVQGTGLLLVYTGNGKGKSSAAFGMVARALGWGMSVGIVQFIKGKWMTGERRFFQKFPDQIRFKTMGEGFTWDTQDRARDIRAAEAAWAQSLEMIADPALDLVVLDELNIVLRYDYLSVAEVVEALAGRPRDKHVCVTGRDAPQALMDIADLVTEMSLVRHPFEKGIKATRGIDF